MKKGMLSAALLTTFLAGAWLVSDLGNQSLFRKSASALPILGEVSPFSLTDVDHSEFSSQKLKGSVWVANFIFTNCGGPCPIMTQKMRRLQLRFKDQPSVRFVSISIDPKRDTPDVLRAYAKRFNADLKQWHFLTGEKANVVEIAKKIFKVSAGGGDPNLHSTRFILIDQKGQIRAYHDSQAEKFLDTLERDV